MKMNNYLLIDNGVISYYIKKQEIQFLKYTNDMLYIKLNCSDEIESIPLEKSRWEELLDSLFKTGINVRL